MNPFLTCFFYLFLFCFTLTSCISHFSPVPESSTTENSVANETDTSIDIYVIDVGQGDATLVLGQKVDGERTSLLIDAGPLDPDAGAIVLELFQELNLTQLDYLMLTHFDADHLGGFVTTYESTSILWDENCEPTTYFPTQAIIDLGETDKGTESVNEYLACRDANVNLLEQGHFVVGETGNANIGLTIDLGESYVATVVAGNGYVIGQESQMDNIDTENERSFAVLVSGPNEFNFLVMGDLPGATDDKDTANMELALSQTLQDQNVDISILRTAHHGSAESSSSEFLDLIRPEVSIISVGDNSYGHPTCTTLENLFLYSQTVYQTETGSPTSTCAVQEDVTIMNRTIQIHVEDGGFAIEAK